MSRRRRHERMYYRDFDRSTVLGRFDRALKEWFDDMVPMLMLILGMALGIGLVSGVIAGVMASGKPQPSTVPLTVVSTSVQLEEDAFAEAVTPDGEKVLLKGIWVEGDKVDGYAYPRTDSATAAPVYDVSNPVQPGADAVGWGFLGTFGGIFLVAAMLGVYWWVRGFHYRKVHRSRELVNAAISTDYFLNS